MSLELSTRTARNAGAKRNAHLRSAGQAAILTMTLSLPQGMLALPIAMAQTGLVPGLLLLLLIGILNTITVAWTAHHITTFFARHNDVPSLTLLAGARLGTRGRWLAMAGGTALFFLGLLASLVGLARSLADLTQSSAWVWGIGCGLALILITSSRATLSTRLLIGLGLFNIGLLAILVTLTLPLGQPQPAPVPTWDALVTVVGVSLMLFFAPMLTAPVAQQILPHAASPRDLVWGAGAGVALSTGVFMLWAIAVYQATNVPLLAAAEGTVLPLVLAMVPEARLPAILLGLLLLGMTALRCALVLKSLAGEQIPLQWQRWRVLLVQTPTLMSLTIVLILLHIGVGSFTQLIALAGALAASVVSLVIPTLLTVIRSGTVEQEKPGVTYR